MWPPKLARGGCAVRANIASMIPFPAIDPVAFQLGPVAIRWYGISYVVGIALMWWFLSARARKAGSLCSPDEAADAIFYAVLGGVLGGRLGYVLFYNLPAYASDPASIFKVWQGGMSFHGGLLGAIGAVWLFSRRRGRQFFAVSDFLAPATPLGLMCGRIGNFINQELWGAPTDLPWGVVFLGERAGGVPRHPSQLYEAALEGLVLFVLLWWFTRTPRPLMLPSALFLLGYGTARTAVEFVRIPDEHIGYLAFGWLTMGHVLSAPMVIAGAWMIFVVARRGLWPGAPAPDSGRGG
jgi:phosphatidylglycerol:prolipoprotein diacylglycerol transferase